MRRIHGRHGAGRRLRWVALAAALSLSALASHVAGEAARGTTAFAPPRAFLFEGGPTIILESLWDESILAREERVACLGGYFDGDVFHITRAARVRRQVADSIRSAAGPSIDQCAPPDWIGTAHTHIRGIRGGPRLRTFSGSDRAVMALWRSRWRQEGVFCVLYSANEAYCEYGMSLSGPAEYSVRPPDPDDDPPRRRSRLPVDGRAPPSTPPR